MEPQILIATAGAGPSVSPGSAGAVRHRATRVGSRHAQLRALCREAQLRRRALLASGRDRLYARPHAPSAAETHAMERTLDPTRLGDHLDRLYRAAWGLTGSREDAEDLVQETFARVLSRPRLIRNEDDLGYLLRALRNTFLNRRRSEQARIQAAPLPDELDLLADPHAREPLAVLEAGEVYAAVAALPGDFRDVLVAVDITGLSYKETARALKIREGTVMSRLYRARQQVVRTLQASS
jgi:RNA polymerase sigma-70 factor (ECF subfamily)